MTRHVQAEGGGERKGGGRELDPAAPTLNIFRSKPERVSARATALV